MASMIKRYLDNHPEENPFFHSNNDYDYEYELWVAYKQDEEYRNLVYQKMIECNLRNDNIYCYEANCPKCNVIFID